MYVLMNMAAVIAQTTQGSGKELRWLLPLRTELGVLHAEWHSNANATVGTQVANLRMTHKIMPSHKPTHRHAKQKACTASHCP